MVGNNTKDKLITYQNILKLVEKAKQHNVDSTYHSKNYAIIQQGRGEI
uniref:Uncharacterized protein n=1 Tax=Anguilla anguilla TaxID=7936 RepID=A0A0E9QBF0_ANGAN